MKRIYKPGIFFLLLVLMTGCGLFKKKCDCPKFGQKPLNQSEWALAHQAVSTDEGLTD